MGLGEAADGAWSGGRMGLGVADGWGFFCGHRPTFWVKLRFSRVAFGGGTRLFKRNWDLVGMAFRDRTRLFKRNWILVGWRFGA